MTVMSEQTEARFSEDPEIAMIEREAVKQLAATAREYVTKLPSTSRWRDPLISISDLNAVERQEAAAARRVREIEAVVLTPENVAWLREHVRADLQAVVEEGLDLPMVLRKEMSPDAKTRLHVELASDLSHVLDCLGWETEDFSDLGGGEQYRTLMFTRPAVRALEFMRAVRADPDEDPEASQRIDRILAVQWAGVSGERD
jgi:hypothetical protein